jgi:hypothetical protein
MAALRILYSVVRVDTLPQAPRTALSTTAAEINTPVLPLLSLPSPARFI